MAYETYYDRYKELQALYKIKHGTYDLLTKEQRELPRFEQELHKQKAAEQYDVVVEYAGAGYAHMKYRVLRNKPNLSMKELAIICDEGNLCFGYRVENGIICVYTD